MTFITEKFISENLTEIRADERGVVRVSHEPAIVVGDRGIRVVRLGPRVRVEVQSLDAMGALKWDDGTHSITSAQIALSLLADEVMTLRHCPAPMEMILHCPRCGAQHLDAPEPAEGWTDPPHRSHLCATPGCRTIWRPADVPTRGVREIRTRGERDTWTPTAITLAEPARRTSDTQGDSGGSP